MSEDINRSESGASITLSKSFRVEDGLVIEEILSAADAAAVAGSASIELDQQQDMILTVILQPVSHLSWANTPT